MRLISAGILLDSLKIDRLEKRWTARGLFLVIFGIFVSANLWPIGNPNFSAWDAWYDELYKQYETFLYASTETFLATPDIGLPATLAGNMLYICFVIAIGFVITMLAFLYTRIYIGDRSGQKITASLGAYFRRLPLLFLFLCLYFIFCVVLIFAATITIGLIIPQVTALLYLMNPLILLSGLIFAPIEITYSRTGLIEALLRSIRYTRGFKFSIFWGLLALFCMYTLTQFVFHQFLGTNSGAGILIDGFLLSFLLIAFGRQAGILYDKIKLHPEPDKAEEEE